MPAVLSAYNRWNSRVSTGQLNAWLRAAQSAHAKGGMANALGRVRYVIQTAARPPHFVAFLAGGDPLQKDQEKGLLRRVAAQGGVMELIAATGMLVSMQYG